MTSTDRRMPPPPAPAASPTADAARAAPRTAHAPAPGNSTNISQRIVILGGGFGGVYTAQHLEKLFKRDPGVEITLVSRENYFLMTPLLFEASSGVLEPRHAVSPIRLMFDKARFVDAVVERIDFDARKVFARHSPDNYLYELDYDNLVLALGGVTNRGLIPGSEHAAGFKTLADAIYLRNRIIDRCEQADVEENPKRRQELLTFVIVGGGLVGVELMGELTEFVWNLLESYPRIPREYVRFFLIEGHPRILPEMEEDLAAYAARTLRKRGVKLLTNTRVQGLEPCRVILPAGSAAIEAETIILAAGVGPNPLLETFPLEKSRKGRIVVSPTMRCGERPEVWALGDCAEIPDPRGHPYPQLAQHALREAKTLARNIAAVVRRPEEKPTLKAFDYQMMGMLASLGYFDGVGRIGTIHIRGFFAWWIWRTYYVFQMPRWARRIRVILDWTVALLFKNDIVKLDVFSDEDARQRSKAVPRPVQRVE